jgi:hypothetical protein
MIAESEQNEQRDVQRRMGSAESEQKRGGLEWGLGRCPALAGGKKYYKHPGREAPGEGAHPVKGARVRFRGRVSRRTPREVSTR